MSITMIWSWKTKVAQIFSLHSHTLIRFNFMAGNMNNVKGALCADNNMCQNQCHSGVN